MVARDELKSYNCGKKLQEQKLSCDIETEGRYIFRLMISKKIKSIIIYITESVVKR